MNKQKPVKKVINISRKLEAEEERAERRILEEKLRDRIDVAVDLVRYFGVESQDDETKEFLEYALEQKLTTRETLRKAEEFYTNSISRSYNPNPNKL